MALPTKRRYRQIVTDEGELIAIQEKQSAQGFDRKFVTMFDETMELLAKTITNGATLRVLLMLPPRLDNITWRELGQQALADELGLSRRVVGQALADLHQLGILDRKGQGPMLRWRLTPRLSWRGRAEKYRQAVRERASAASAAKRLKERRLQAR